MIKLPAILDDARPSRLRTAAISVVLFALNAYICLNLFRTEYTSHLESIEAAYIGISRYIMDHGLHLDWFAPWYVGIPFQNTYPPLLHVLVALAARVFGMSPALSHHAVSAFFYCMAAVFVYWMAQRLSGSWRMGFVVGAVFSLWCPSALLSTTAQTWTATPWGPTRFLAVILFGDSPHVTSIALVPLAILALDWALELRTPVRVFLAALALAAVVLTNWLGAFALAMAVASYLLALVTARQPWIRESAWTAGIGVLAYAIAFPWIPPSTLSRIKHNAQYTIGNYPIGIQQVKYAVALAGVTAFLLWLMRRESAGKLTAFAVFFSLFSSSIIALSERFAILLMPQPHRYHHEMDLGIVIATVCLLFVILRHLRPEYAISLFVILTVLGVFQTRYVRREARQVVGAIDMSKTLEYEFSIWLRDHLKEGRVFISGSTQFWLTVFTDTPQVGGGFGQGIVNPQIPAVHYGIPWTLKDGADTAMWLRLYGATAVVVAGPGSRDAYPQVWRDPAKFDGVLPELFRDGGDVIYAVPMRSASLAHVIRSEHVVTRAPENNVDFAPVRPLAAALEDPALPVASMQFDGPSHGVIRANLAADELLFVQVSYHKGWHASVNGANRPIKADGLGFMVVDPQCVGACEVHLDYDGGFEMKFALLMSASAVLGVLGAWPLYRRFRPAPAIIQQ